MEDKKKESFLEPLSTAKEIQEAIEAILFAAGYPMRYDKLAEVLSLSVKDVKNIVGGMADHYAEAENSHGILLLTYPTSCQLTTRETYAPYIREALGIRRGGNLSASSMEVLAVVAYNQPVTRSFIDLVRGVDSSYAVGSLLDKELIRADGRLDAPGRPMLYVTTEKFLRVFGINSLEELPETEALSVAATAVAETSSEDGEQLTVEDELAADQQTIPADYTDAVDPEESNVIPEVPDADYFDTTPEDFGE